MQRFRKRSSAVFQLWGFFFGGIFSDLKGAENEGFITLVAQFLQVDWYTKTVHEKDRPACFKHGGTVLMNVHKMYSLEPQIILSQTQLSRGDNYMVVTMVGQF